MKMNKLYKNWGVHNLVGHPLMQIFSWLGMRNAPTAVHDGTLPQEQNQ